MADSTAEVMAIPITVAMATEAFTIITTGVTVGITTNTLIIMAADMVADIDLVRRPLAPPIRIFIPRLKIFNLFVLFCL